MTHDFVLVGGGLANGLIALALRRWRPAARVAVVERAADLGGNHTWSHHAGDVGEEMRPIIDELVEHEWPGYEVRFPDCRRELALSYRSFGSASLSRAVARAAARSEGRLVILRGAEAVVVGAHHVSLSDGRRLEGRLVVDARGPASDERAGQGYQKFVGLELEVDPDGPARFERPLLMDAKVPQEDGFRFVYVLPFGRDRLLVEDTRFSDGAALDVAALRGHVLAYAEARGVRVRRVLREEQGVLPLPWRGQAEPDWSSPEAGPVRAGYGAGLFHPVTGYSLPVAARFAAVVARLTSAGSRDPALAAFMDEHARQARFGRLLNWLLFRAVAPGERWRVLERFYRLPEDVVARFYALALTPRDRARLLCGRPPGGLSLRTMLGRSEVPV